MSVQLILKNSSAQDKAATASQLEIGEIALNYHKSGPFIQCKDTAGQVWRIGGVIVADVAPGHPQPGAWWFKTGTKGLYFYDGTSWTEITAATVDATTTAKGMVQLADASAIAAGTAGLVVDAAQLKVVNDAIATATGGGITGLTGNAPITVIGSGATRAIGINAATAVAAGSMSAADKSKLDGIAAYTLPAATTSVLGGIKVGAGLTVTGDGTLKSSVTGALVFKGSADPTAVAPAAPATGDVWVMNKAGTLSASWTGAAGQPVQLHEVVAWDGAEWTVMGSTGGTGVATVTATAPLHSTGTNAVALTVDAASTTTSGVVQLATDAEATAGTATDRAVTPAQLKANVPTVVAASTTKAGIVQLADGAAITAGTVGRVVDAAQLKAAVPADASETVKGIAEIATTAEANAGTDDQKIVTPLKLKGFQQLFIIQSATRPTLVTHPNIVTGTIWVDQSQSPLVLNVWDPKLNTGLGGWGTTADSSETVKGLIELATTAEVDAGTDTVKAVTPKTLADNYLAKNIADLAPLP